MLGRGGGAQILVHSVQQPEQELERVVLSVAPELRAVLGNDILKDMDGVGADERVLLQHSPQTIPATASAVVLPLQGHHGHPNASRAVGTPSTRSVRQRFCGVPASSGQKGTQGKPQ